MQRDYAKIQWVLVITFILNLVATFAKLGVGLWTGTLSLIADGLDTLFDGISNIIGLVAVRISSQPPDREHPYGHRKFETLAALFIAAALFISHRTVQTHVAHIFEKLKVHTRAAAVSAAIAAGLVEPPGGD